MSKASYVIHVSDVKDLVYMSNLWHHIYHQCTYSKPLDARIFLDVQIRYIVKSIDVTVMYVYQHDSLGILTSTNFIFNESLIIIV